MKNFFSILRNKEQEQPDFRNRPADAVIIFQSELDYLSRCILDYPNIETGGQLFGYWTSTGTPVVLYAIGPGLNANHQVTFFNQDLDYLEQIGGVLVKEFGLQHMGEWHSHHQLGLAQPSGHDASTIYNNMLRHQLPRFLLCIGNCTNSTSTINAFNFHEDSSDYQHSTWEVVNLESPFRRVIDNRLANLLVHPVTKHPCLTGMRMKYTSSQKPKTSLHYAEGYWLNEKGNSLLLKQMLDFVKDSERNAICRVTLDTNGLAHISANDANGSPLLDIVFPMGFPKVPPQIVSEKDGFCATALGWNPAMDDLTKSFIEYYKMHNL